MNSRLEKQVRRRAQDRCEYCRLPQSVSRIRHQIDHIIATQHGGPDEASNLAVACIRCNLRKGPNLAGLDSVSGKLVPLFNPRSDRWCDHFEWQGPLVVGLSPIGRATIQVLNINDPAAIEVRQVLIDEGLFPPI